jgi:hypothetical protein
MSNPTVLFRSLLVYAFCVPIALFLGYLLASPELFLVYRTQTILVAVMLMILVSPLFLKYYHPWLIASWNMSTVLFFLPGNPQLWMGLTAIGLTIALLQYILSRDNRILSAPTLTKPLIAITIVTLATAYFRGGIGLRSFGADVYGGKRYFMIVLSVLGFFALASRRIPPHRAGLYAVLFFLGSGTMAIGSLAGRLPSQFNFLFLIFPVENLSFLSNITQSVMSRSWGLSLLGLGIFCAMLAKYGVKGIVSIQHPQRFVFFIVFCFLGLMGGFRSILIIFILTFVLLMYLEGLMQTRLLPALLLVVILGGALTTAFATRLPLSVQRTLAFLPIAIDPIAKRDAQASSEWRIRMWQNVLPEIPENLLLGKGYLFSSTDEFMFRFKGGEESAKGSELVGDYHNGPLSVILPFGLPGVFAFLWFMVAATKAVYANYRYGDPEYEIVNRFIFAYFVARVIFFFAVFGSLYSDLALFTGLVGLSVSLNGGVAKPAAEEQPRFAFGRVGLAAP